MSVDQEALLEAQAIAEGLNGVSDIATQTSSEQKIALVLAATALGIPIEYDPTKTDELGLPYLKPYDRLLEELKLKIRSQTRL